MIEIPNLNEIMQRRFDTATKVHQQGLDNVKNEAEPKKKKFPCGSFVKIADDLHGGMDHFASGIPAMVEYTYAHAYGSDDIDSYSLIIRETEGIDRYKGFKGESYIWSSCAWYEEDQLTLITDKALINKFKKELLKNPPKE